MKSKFSLSILLFFLCSFSFAQIKIDKAHFIDLLNEGNYDQAYSELVILQKQPLGKCCLTDYLIAKSLCLSGFPKAAQSRYTNILIDYKQLPPDTKKFIEQEENSCLSETGELTAQTTSAIIVFPTPSASIRGKLGMVYNCFQSYEAVHVLKQISEEEFNSRLFSVSQADSAVKKIRSLIPPGYSVFAKDNFILVTFKGSDTTELKKEEVIRELVKTLHFYSSYYHLRLPDKLLTAYIVPDNKSLQTIAASVHGINVPKENYGYSSLNDLSIFGISNKIGTGTLKHELFHIVVRGDIGDIPAWLDEGIATLYEESHWENDILVSNKNFWRTQVLQKSLKAFQLFSKLPYLKTLINYSWNEFEGMDKGDICKASVNYAFAKHFVVYLESTGKLKAVLDAYKNKRGDDKADIIKSNAEILEQVFGKSTDSIELLFDKWLIKTYSLSILDPLSNRNIDGGEREGMEVFFRFKKNIRQATAIYDSLLRTADTSASFLQNQISRSQLLFGNEANRFDSKMRVLFLQNGGHADESMMHAAFDFIQEIRIINSDFENAIKSYKK